VLGMLGLGIALSELPWGLLTDRWGDRRVLLLGLGATAVSLAGMALFVVPGGAYVPGLTMLASGLLLVGLLGGSVNGSSGRAVMAWFRDGERGLAMSIRQTAVPAGGGLGALMLPALAAHFGFASVYGVLALLCAVTAAFAWYWLHEPSVHEHSDSRPGVAGAMASDVLSASAWHGVAFTELATLAGTRRAGTALAMGNTFAFSTLFLTPLIIPLLLSVGSWPLVWALASACALIALPVFPRAVVAGAHAAAPAQVRCEP